MISNTSYKVLFGVVGRDGRRRGIGSVDEATQYWRNWGKCAVLAALLLAGRQKLICLSLLAGKNGRSPECERTSSIRSLRMYLVRIREDIGQDISPARADVYGIQAVRVFECANTELAEE